MATQNFLVIKDNTVIDSHVWDISANPSLPEMYDPSTHQYIQCDSAGIGYTLLNGVFSKPVHIPQNISLPIQPPDLLTKANETIAAQALAISKNEADILTLHASISAIINQLNANQTQK